MTTATCARVSVRSGLPILRPSRPRPPNPPPTICKRPAANRQAWFGGGESRVVNQEVRERLAEFLDAGRAHLGVAQVQHPEPGQGQERLQVRVRDRVVEQVEV